MRRLGLILLMLASSTEAMANPGSARLWVEATPQGEVWTVVPHLETTPGRWVRYEVSALKRGRSGQANTRQSGGTAAGKDGSAALTKLSISIGPRDTCIVEIRVFDGNLRLGEWLLHLPENALTTLETERELP